MENATVPIPAGHESPGSGSSDKVTVEVEPKAVGPSLTDRSKVAVSPTAGTETVLDVRLTAKFLSTVPTSNSNGVYFVVRYGLPA